MARTLVARTVVDPDGVELVYRLTDDITHVAFQRLLNGAWQHASSHRSERAARKYWGQQCHPGGGVVICPVQEVTT